MKRTIESALTALLLTLTLAACGQPETADAAEGETMREKTAVAYPVTKSDEEWRRELSPEQYRVLRQHGTERAFTGEYHDHHEKGVYVCAACGQELFSSDHKFDSGTGWPSFWQPIAEQAVGTTTDRSSFMTRTEVHCSRCGGHLGHVFEDGPRPDRPALLHQLGLARVRAQEVAPLPLACERPGRLNRRGGARHRTR